MTQKMEMNEHSLSRRGLIKTSLLGLGAASVSAPTFAKATNDAQGKATYDAIVLGAGPAGLVTAITAHDAGAKVVVCEKRDRPDGNAIFAIGSVCGWGSRHQKEQGISDTAEAFYKMMMDISQQMGDPILNRVYTDNIPSAIDWLESEIGVKFKKIRMMPYPRLGRTCRVDGEGITGGSQLVQKLLAACQKRGIEILWEHKGVELLHNDKFEVIGVKVLTPVGTKTLFSKSGVAIATGGFSANPGMVDQYIGGGRRAWSFAALAPRPGKTFR